MRKLIYTSLGFMIVSFANAVLGDILEPLAAGEAVLTVLVVAGIVAVVETLLTAFLNEDPLTIIRQAFGEQRPRSGHNPNNPQ